MIKVTPMRAYCLIEPMESPAVSELIITMEKDEQPQRGLVLKVGETVKDIEVADRVVFNHAMGILTGIEDTILVPEDAIYLRVTDG